MSQQIIQQPNDPNLFLNSAVGDFNDKTSDDSGYGTLPGVEQNQTYFAYYDGVSRQDPELPKQTAFYIKYLIDTNGNVVKPQPNDTSVINIVDNFETGKPVIITTKTPTTELNLLLGEKTVTNVGELSTLLVTNTGSGQLDYFPTMSFRSNTGENFAQTASDYNFAARSFRAQTITNVPDPVNNTLVTFPGVAISQSTNIGQYLYFAFVDNTPEASAATWDVANGTYTFNKSTTEGRSRVQFSFDVNAMCYRFKFNSLTTEYTDNNQNFGDYPAFTIVVFQVKCNGQTIYTSGPKTLTNFDRSQYFYATTPFFNFNAGDVITFWITPLLPWPPAFISSDFNTPVVFTQAQGGGTKIQVINENQNLEGIVDGVTSAFSDYFTIGEYPDQNGTPEAVYTSTSVITASQSLTSLYRENIVQIAPSKSLDYGYMQPWQPFYPLLPGDRIIFENSKNNVHVITEVIPSITASNGSSSFGLRVVPGIPTGSIINNFCIYRILNNGNQIIIDQEKPEGTAGLDFRGFIRPKYISQELETKFIDIINKLEADGVIE